MLKEFKEFALKGNVLDMAIGVIIGSAFSKIVTSLVNEIIMPILSLLTGGINFTDLKWVISPAVLNEAGEVLKKESALLYGSFLQNILDFFLVAISLFIVVKIMNRLRRKKEEPAPAPAPKGPSTEELLGEIRDILKEK